MSDHYKIIYEGGCGEVTEKKSRFLAHIFSVESEEEANQWIEKLKKKYWDAAHNCFAYTIGENHQLQRCSDDGEPSGTAGRPMLDILLGEDVHNALAVVTRYFGGTLLGTGGLVRAYSKTVQEGLKNSTIIEKHAGEEWSVKTDYQGLGKIQYKVKEWDFTIRQILYTEEVQLKIIIPKNKSDFFQKHILEISNGKAELSKIQKLYYGKVKEEIVFLS